MKKVLNIYPFPKMQQSPQLGVFDAACMLNGKLYIPVYNMSGVFVFDCQQKTIQYLTIGNSYGYTNIEAAGEDILLISKLPDLVRFHPRTSKYEHYEIVNRTHWLPHLYYVNICEKDGAILIFPAPNAKGDKPVIYISPNGKMSCIRNSTGYVMVSKLSDGRMAALDELHNLIDVYDYTGKIIKQVHLSYSKELQQEWHDMWRLGNFSGKLFETVDAMSLDDFITYCIHTHDQRQQNPNAGLRIYQTQS